MGFKQEPMEHQGYHYPFSKGTMGPVEKRPIVMPVLVTICIILLVLLNLILADKLSNTVDVPKCQEDETYLKGSGDYSNGHFETYVCVHPDNLKGGS